MNNSSAREKGIVGVAILLIALVAVFIFVGGYFLIKGKSTGIPGSGVCTEEAKICPDGTSVGRTGPQCAFAPCPTTTQRAPWKTYSNKTYHYSIDYPTDWVVREYPGTGTGAGFRPSSSPDDPSSEVVSIDIRAKSSESTSLPFADYVKIAAQHEIQNYKTIVSNSPIETNSHILGFVTTWDVAPPPGASGAAAESLPIAYFPIPGNTEDTLQVSLGDALYEDIYMNMLSTLHY